MMPINTPNNEFAVNMAKQVNDEGLANMNKLVKGIFNSVTGGAAGAPSQASGITAAGLPMSL